MRHPLLFILVLFSLHFGPVLFATSLFSYDAFYHFAVAKELSSHGIFQGIKALPFTVIGLSGVDHYLLFHVLLSPFTILYSFLGIKIATAFFAALPTIAFYYLLLRLKVKDAWFYTLLLFAFTPGYLIRMSMLKAQTLSVFFVLIFSYALFQRRKWAIIVITSLFCWTYHGAIVVFPLVLFYSFVRYLETREIDYSCVLYVLVGYLIGLEINPYFPSNIEYLLFPLGFKISNPLSLDVGAEWAPMSLSFFVKEFWSLSLVLCGGIYLAFRKKGFSPHVNYFLLVSFFFLGHSFCYGRMLEYWIPCSIFLIALLWHKYCLKCIAVKRLSVTIVLVLCGYNLSIAKGVIDSGNNPESFAKISQY